jgi:hypothetical protein
LLRGIASQFIEIIKQNYEIYNASYCIVSDTGIKIDNLLFKKSKTQEKGNETTSNLVTNWYRITNQLSI